MPRDVQLLQFRFSPYNEKARWALDYKRIPHRRQSLLPGPHLGKVRRLTGQTKTPVVIIDGEAIHGSARIVERLQRDWPEPALYPADPELREQAIEIERRFDDDIQPRIRRALLSSMLDDSRYVAEVFGGDHGAIARFFYAATFPLARPLVRKSNGITGQAAIDDGIAAAQEGLDFVQARAGGQGYLVGDSFSIADLTVAAHLAGLVDPPHPDMQRPQPAPASVSAWLARWRAHPGAAWVLEMYRRHRPVHSGRDVG